MTLSTMFTRSEIDTFDEYVALLIVLCEQEHGGFDGHTMLAHTCVACARRVLAGVPSQLRASELDVCPACVRIKKMTGPLRTRLGKSAEQVGVPIKDTHAFRSQLRSADTVLPKRRTDRMRGLVETLKQRIAESKDAGIVRSSQRQMEILERIIKAEEEPTT